MSESTLRRFDAVLSGPTGTVSTFTWADSLHGAQTRLAAQMAADSVWDGWTVASLVDTRPLSPNESWNACRVETHTPVMTGDRVVSICGQPWTFIGVTADGQRVIVSGEAGRREFHPTTFDLRISRESRHL